MRGEHKGYMTAFLGKSLGTSAASTLPVRSSPLWDFHSTSPYQETVAMLPSTGGETLGFKQRYDYVPFGIHLLGFQ